MTEYLIYFILIFHERPEEFRGFYQKAIGKEAHSIDQKIPEELYEEMAAMGLMKK